MRRTRRSFQPTVDGLELRLAPGLYGALPMTAVETTMPPDLDPPGTTIYDAELLCTTAPDSTC